MRRFSRVQLLLGPRTANIARQWALLCFWRSGTVCFTSKLTTYVGVFIASPPIAGMFIPSPRIVGMDVYYVMMNDRGDVYCVT